MRPLRPTPFFLTLFIPMLVMVSGCRSPRGSGERVSRNTSGQNLRTQLLLLNLEESSGWVAYLPRESSSDDLEDYRVIVVRQSTGNVIYDSLVPLPTDLETHGFEMEPTDPRLQELARSVDKGIIAPMEAYRKQLKTGKPELKDPEPTAAEEPEATEPPAASSRVDLPPSPPTPTNNVSAEMLGKREVRLTGLGEMALEKGDRVFLRHPPREIAIPGTDERLYSPGVVAGLVWITRVEKDAVVGELLSGIIPEKVHLEKDSRTQP